MEGPGFDPTAVEQREMGVAFVLSACTPLGVDAWEFSGFPPMRHVNTDHHLIKVLRKAGGLLFGSGIKVYPLIRGGYTKCFTTAVCC